MSLSVTYDDTLNPSPETLKFTPEAKEILLEWQKVNTDQSNDAESEAVAGIYSKLEVYAIRLALILEMMRYACNNGDKLAISVEAIQGALKLVEYFKKTAVKVQSIVSSFNPISKQPDDKQDLYKRLPHTFSTEMGLQIAESMGIRKRNYERFLTDKNLFKWTSRGQYKKILINDS